MEMVNSLLTNEYWKQLEERITNFVLDDNHIYLFFGLIAIMALLRYVTPLQKILFTETRKWLAAPINLCLSSVGIFVFKLTPATTTGLKIIVVAILSALTTLLYEAAIKRLVGLVSRWLGRDINSSPIEIKEEQKTGVQQ